MFKTFICNLAYRYIFDFVCVVEHKKNHTHRNSPFQSTLYVWIWVLRVCVWTSLTTRTPYIRLHFVLNNSTLVLTDPHTGKALVIANQSRNVRSNIKRSDYSAVRAAYRSLAAFFIDLRPKWSTVNCEFFFVIFVFMFSFVSSIFISIYNLFESCCWFVWCVYVTNFFFLFLYTTRESVRANVNSNSHFVIFKISLVNTQRHTRKLA